MSFALEFLSQYHTDGEEFLNRIVTVDETWVRHVNVETKQQSMALGHMGTSTRLRTLQTLSARKLISYRLLGCSRNRAYRIQG
ncbi:uncharacterized protein NPIL_425661 [Nephila pilipes]|uniref:Transposase n=1 Tax=Nephila pilipes TaxID=299642 RepID=A0A8X6UD92_NEPPI|nr:uncharacterized protein NPIL_425661 [Nephila pilipes]